MPFPAQPPTEPPSVPAAPPDQGIVRPGEGRKPSDSDQEEVQVPAKSSNVKNEKQYEALKDKGMSKERKATAKKGS